MSASTRRIATLHDEDGFVAVIAIIVMVLMLSIGLAAVALTDGQTRRSGTERVRESSFNLAEGALSQQSFLLGGKSWPKTPALAPPPVCDQTTTTTAAQVKYCPTPAALVTTAGTGAYSGPDYGTDTTWSTTVRDNVAVNNQVYSSAVDSQLTYDANNDAYIWVKSTATVRGKKRTLVALLKRDSIPLLLPKAVLVAGSLKIPQNGQSPVITTDATAPVVLRCSAYGSNCNESDSGQGTAQISPNSVTYSPGLGSFMPGDALQKVIDSATTYTACPGDPGGPTDAQLSGLVVIDVANSVTCRFSGNNDVNSPAAPGILIMRRGTLDYRGNGSFYGLILHLNEGNSNQGTNCVDVTGTPTIHGGIIVEGNCGFQQNGNSRLVFDPNMLNFAVTGVAGLVQNTFRELPPGS